ncbi:phosphoglucosamine mutase [Boudabousia liubingyangii]|uniref:Phosphoglucosamine mutase n=1 Tax=Boudabousia liubingyangii TaxID=1921764 RepID=A0A1Q5PQA8_9ACTO|nr:phosphoglucosamine mutase [Boudabousia liubingyangii]OKL48221.1 phosphoglucosamine mutase [Boudabousia liubingyangii]OKL49744.1 phosphoglucosamine mutase [Boudabousia liubingyangii]
MARLFGTDGVRGLANRDITADLALKLGQAAARYTLEKLPAKRRNSEQKPKAIIGRDTRVSGEFLSHAIAAGLASAGMDVVRIGIVPTPAVAFLMTSGEYDLGVMISASHNPMPDNGIKFFAKGGFKLEDAVEDEIQALLENAEGWEAPTGEGVGEITSDHAIADRAYVNHLLEACDTPLKGLRIAVDCANGAASFLGPEALREAGADVVVMNASPDGRNINDDCGSTHPEQLQAVVVASKAAFGVAFDGDADRCLAVDHEGNLIDGDKIMGMLAVGLKKSGRLNNDTLVVTVMSNLGLKLAMEKQGIKTVQTAVGDRYVLEEILASGHALGGEQSGHVINAHYATTGDGILTALMIARDVKRSGKTLAELTSFIQRLPQTLINVPNVDKNGLESEVIQDAVAKAEAFLGDTGRVLLRASGTEPLVRVMVEAATQTEADAAAQRLADVVAKELAL